MVHPLQTLTAELQPAVEKELWSRHLEGLHFSPGLTALSMSGLGIAPFSFQTLTSCLWIARAEVTWHCRVKPVVQGLYKSREKVWLTEGGTTVPTSKIVGPLIPGALSTDHTQRLGEEPGNVWFWRLGD